MAAFDDTESVLFRDRWPNRTLCGDAGAARLGVDAANSALPGGPGLPPGLSRPMPRRKPASPDSLALGEWRRALSMSMFLRRALWFASAVMVPLFRGGIVFVRDCEKRRPEKPGPGAFMGVCVP